MKIIRIILSQIQWETFSNWWNFYTFIFSLFAYRCLSKREYSRTIYFMSYDKLHFEIYQFFHTFFSLVMILNVKTEIIEYFPYFVGWRKYEIKKVPKAKQKLINFLGSNQN